MPESVYKVIELIGTSSEFLGKGRRQRGRASLENLSGIFASRRSSNSTCNWTPREK